MGAPRWFPNRGPHGSWGVEDRWTESGEQRRTSRFFRVEGEGERALERARKEAERHAGQMKELRTTKKTLERVGLAVPRPEPEASPLPLLSEFEPVFLGWLASSQASPNTISAYSSYLRVVLIPILGKLRLDEITPAVVAELRAALRDEGRKSDAPVLGLSSLMACALDHYPGRLSGNPCHVASRRMKRMAAAQAEGQAREPRAWSRDQRKLVLEAIPAEQELVRAAVLLGAWCGLRKGEIRGLQPESVDLRAGLVSVVNQLIWSGGSIDRPPKDNSSRVVPLPEVVSSGLSPLLARAKAKGLRYLLATEATGLPPVWKHPRSGLWRWLALAQKAAGVPEPYLTPHGMRSTAYSLWIQAGVPAALADAWLGHSLRGASPVGEQHYWAGWDPKSIDPTLLAAVRADYAPTGLEAGQRKPN